MEIITYYILPNIFLFGGIIALSKMIEYIAWTIIMKYCDSSTN